MAPLLAVVGAALGCAEDSLPPLPDSPEYVLTQAEGRPAQAYVPRDYDPNTAYPVVILLHGYGAGGGAQNLYFGISNHTTAQQFILLVPNGTRDASGSTHWNSAGRADDVDDVAYLRRLLDEASANFRVDRRRVYLFGHSNGGFMSYRMACEAADVISAIASLNGMPVEDASACAPERAVSVLHIHGTDDDSVAYDGVATSTGGGYPSAPESVRRFAAAAGCDTSAPSEGAPLDLDDGLAGDETEVVQYQRGCRRGLDAELWTIVGGGHLPERSDTFVPLVVEWLQRHRL
jgi:polyhydroxybutyrate depolymerase